MKTKDTAKDAALAREKSHRKNLDDQYAQLERQRMMAMLAQQGYTPFGDAQRARQGSIYGR